MSNLARRLIWMQCFPDDEEIFFSPSFMGSLVTGKVPHFYTSTQTKDSKAHRPKQKYPHASLPLLVAANKRIATVPL